VPRKWEPQEWLSQEEYRKGWERQQWVFDSVDLASGIGPSIYREILFSFPPLAADKNNLQCPADELSLGPPGIMMPRHFRVRSSSGTVWAWDTPLGNQLLKPGALLLQPAIQTVLLLGAHPFTGGPRVIFKKILSGSISDNFHNRGIKCVQKAVTGQKAEKPPKTYCGICYRASPHFLIRASHILLSWFSHRNGILDSIHHVQHSLWS
jgi:hypothetical protein